MLRTAKPYLTTMAVAATAAATFFVPIRNLRPTYAAAVPASKTSGGWTAYNGQQTGDHYSPLNQINRANVAKLKVAWTFDTHEEGGLQTNPLIIGRTLFAYTPFTKNRRSGRNIGQGGMDL